MLAKRLAPSPSGFSNQDDVVSLPAPVSTATCAWPDIALLYAAPIYVDLGEDAAMAVLPVRTQDHFIRLHKLVQPTLGDASARLVQLGGIDVRQPHFSLIAHQSVAIDGDATLACGGRKGAKPYRKGAPAHAAITRSS